MLSLCHVLVPCYVAFHVGYLLTSVLYGLGRTGLIAATSAAGNVFLVALFLMVTFGVIENSVMAVAAIFGSVLVLGMFLTGSAYAFILVKQNPSI